ncbi:hypothetical protein [Anaerosinus sp.]|uniref:hypothetical protein n=1 Tax=Selenobaculum sp. TaxID=3074374 RepID=UPI003AB6ED78
MQKKGIQVIINRNLAEKHFGERRTIRYQVTDEKAIKKVKNIILMIGDGISLQPRELSLIPTLQVGKREIADII